MFRTCRLWKPQGCPLISYSYNFWFCLQSNSVLLSPGGFSQFTHPVEPGPCENGKINHVLRGQFQLNQDGQKRPQFSPTPHVFDAVVSWGHLGEISDSLSIYSQFHLQDARKENASL